MKGGTVCQKHGGRAPHVLAAAKVRLQMASEQMVDVLLRIAQDESLSPSDRRQAAVAVLDRAGFTAKAELEIGVTLKPWEKLMDDGLAFTEDDGTEVVAHVHDYSDREAAQRGEVVSGDVVGVDDRDPNGEW